MWRVELKDYQGKLQNQALDLKTNADACSFINVQGIFVIGTVKDFNFAYFIILLNVFYPCVSHLLYRKQR